MDLGKGLTAFLQHPLVRRVVGFRCAPTPYFLESGMRTEVFGIRNDENRRGWCSNIRSWPQAGHSWSSQGCQVRWGSDLFLIHDNPNFILKLDPFIDYGYVLDIMQMLVPLLVDVILTWSDSWRINVSMWGRCLCLTVGYCPSNGRSPGVGAVQITEFFNNFKGVSYIRRVPRGCRIRGADISNEEERRGEVNYCDVMWCDVYLVTVGSVSEVW